MPVDLPSFAQETTKVKSHFPTSDLCLLNSVAAEMKDHLVLVGICVKETLHGTAEHQRHERSRFPLARQPPPPKKGGIPSGLPLWPWRKTPALRSNEPFLSQEVKVCYVWRLRLDLPSLWIEFNLSTPVITCPFCYLLHHGLRVPRCTHLSR